jgi:hypothetical protein
LPARVIGRAPPGPAAKLLPDQNIADASPVSWNTAALDASILVNYDGSCDRLYLDPYYHTGVAVQGNQILWQSSVIGTLSGQGGQTLRAEFNSSADNVAVGAVLDTLSYSNACPNAALYNDNLPRTVQITLRDGTGQTQTGNAFVEFLYFTRIQFRPNPAYVAPDAYVRVLMLGELNEGGGGDFNYPVYSDADCASVDSSYPEVVVHADNLESGQSNLDCPMSIFTGGQGPRGTLRLRIIGDPCAVHFFKFISRFQPGESFAPGEGLFSSASPTPPAVSVPNFRALESLMGQTAEGHRLASLYREHTAEVVRLMLVDENLRNETLQLVQDFQPGVAALLAGNGSGFQITRQMVDDVNRVAGHFALYGSANLRTAIATETNRLNGLRDFVNKDFNQWAGMLQVSVPSNAWIQLTEPRLANGQFSVEANGVDSFDYSLWRAPDVVGGAWEKVTNAVVALDGFTVSLTDPTPAPVRPFYRARAQKIP